MDLPFTKKKPRVIEVGGQKIELEPKPSKGLGSIFGGGSKPKPKTTILDNTSTPQTAQPQQQTQNTTPTQPSTQTKKPSILGTLGGYKPAQTEKQKISFSSLDIKQKSQVQQDQEASVGIAGVKKKKGFEPPAAWKRYVQGVAIKQKDLEVAMREQGMKDTLYDFIQRMLLASSILGLVVGIGLIVLFNDLGLGLVEGTVLGLVMGIAIFQGSFRTFLQFPMAKGKSSAKNIERDILFAARDMIISLRSGMPLFNSITSISTGYGDASKEFAKIVERVQLGMPLEEAIDATIAQTKSASFRKIMLQASVSIKAGADVVSALQSVIDQLSQERIIELRSYGQRLNALAMFYMLFGVILPSMGIAVITILTTFIAIFTVNTTVLEAVLVGIAFLQILFLKLITGSRPVFSM